MTACNPNLVALKIGIDSSALSMNVCILPPMVLLCLSVVVIIPNGRLTAMLTLFLLVYCMHGEIGSLLCICVKFGAGKPACHCSSAQAFIFGRGALVPFVHGKCHGMCQVSHMPLTMWQVTCGLGMVPVHAAPSHNM
jgi:hypothetical protein